MSVAAPDWRAEAEAMYQALSGWRRDLHEHPELAFGEERTAACVAAVLGASGLEVREGYGGTGVIGRLRGGQPGPTVMLRADMDALPMQELADVPYRSQVPGVMHACGHDGHVAMLLGAANLLARHAAGLPGQVLFLFQPGEEGLGGARAVIEAGGLADPRPAAIFGLHLANTLPWGRIVAQSGPMMAAADIVRITLHGRGGHGARPHETVDAIAVAGQVLSALQTIVSRNVDPQETAVLTIGMIHGGTAFNIIAEEVSLDGTIRTFAPAVRATIMARLQALLDGITSGMGARYDLEVQSAAPPVINDPATSEIARAAAIQVAGAGAVARHAPLMSSEDFAEYLALVPGCYMLVGCGNAEVGLTMEHHNPRFDFDERALPVGAALLAACAARYLSEKA